MLNLSDKELDRLARQAANEYDPGDLASRGHWDKLEAGLNRELGRVRPNPFRLIRRIPFYYAPAILLLVGVSYYFIRQGKSNIRSSESTPATPLATAKTESSGGSPPLVVVKPFPTQSGQGSNHASANTKFNPDKSTSTPEKENGTATTGATANGSKSGSNRPNSSKANGNTPNGNTPNGVTATDKGPSGTIATDNSSNPASANGTASNGTGANRNPGKVIRYPGNIPGSSGVRGDRPSHRLGHGHSPANGNTQANGNLSARGNEQANGNRPARGNEQANGDAQANGNRPIAGNSPGTRNPKIASEGSPEKEPALSVLQGPLSLGGSPVVDDSGLRGFSAAKMVGPITLGKSNGPFTRIGRPLQFGLSLAPDFASVNSLAGDKPGSSIGITIDYQFTNRLYLSTGLLFSRKNYTATTEDYHVPYGYYTMNNMHDVNFVKGSFNLLEIPLNLRYDFSVSGNTVFFLSGGLSSYLLTRENCNYYYNLFGREVSRDFTYTGNGTHLFSAIDLSMGVETGLTNDLSLLIAPYVKIPTGGIGFGRVEMNSFGVNFSLKYSPVLKRTRHR